LQPKSKNSVIVGYPLKANKLKIQKVGKQRNQLN